MAQRLRILIDGWVLVPNNIHNICFATGIPPINELIHLFISVNLKGSSSKTSFISRLPSNSFPGMVAYAVCLVNNFCCEGDSDFDGEFDVGKDGPGDLVGGSDVSLLKPGTSDQKPTLCRR